MSGTLALLEVPKSEMMTGTFVALPTGVFLSIRSESVEVGGKFKSAPHGNISCAFNLNLPPKIMCTRVALQPCRCTDSSK